MSRLMQWLRRWRQRNDLHLFKRSDPIEELREIVGEAQERDVDDERRLYRTLSLSYRGSGSRGGEFGGRATE
jgi:hypothetical protein